MMRGHAQKMLEWQDGMRLSRRRDIEGLYSGDMHQNSQFPEPYGLAEDGDGNPK
jgi:hypothetical protein